MNRFKKNHVKVQRTTGDLNVDGPINAITTFWVMQAIVHDHVFPADAVVSQEFADNVVDLIVKQGPELSKLMEKLNIIGEYSEERGCHTHVDVESLKLYSHRHCVVIQGHLQRKYWPRLSRKTAEHVSLRLCTCLTYCQHAECEHKLFIDGLVDREVSRSLQNAPSVRPRGRRPLESLAARATQARAVPQKTIEKRNK